MPYIMVRHKVTNYAKWKRGAQAIAKFRKESGEKCFYVCRGSEDTNDLLVWCEWDTTARMKKFAASPILLKAMKDAGVIGKPEISFYGKMDDLSVK
jgi:hypothetical protein